VFNTSADKGSMLENMEKPTLRKAVKRFWNQWQGKHLAELDLQTSNQEVKFKQKSIPAK
jgi:hypothetical protein